MRRTAACLVLCLLFCASGAGAEAPRLFSYQGSLYDSSGAPVTGSRGMTFSLYAAASGGGALWSETHASVTVSGGVYSVVLGETTPLDLDLGQALWLGVAVGSDAEMTPRTRLTAAPQALWASGAPWQGLSGKPSNVIHVAKSGGDFASIQSALDSITDASADNPYLVLVGPGVYEEQVVLKAHAHVQGAGQDVTVIRPVEMPLADGYYKAAVYANDAPTAMSDLTVAFQTEGDTTIGGLLAKDAGDWVTLRRVRLAGETGKYLFGIKGQWLRLQEVAVSLFAKYTAIGIELYKYADLKDIEIKQQNNIGYDSKGLLINDCRDISVHGLRVRLTGGRPGMFTGVEVAESSGAQPARLRDLDIMVGNTSSEASQAFLIGTIADNSWMKGMMLYGPVVIQGLDAWVSSSGDATGVLISHEDSSLQEARLEVEANEAVYGLSLEDWRIVSDVFLSLNSYSQLYGVTVGGNGVVRDLDIKATGNGNTEVYGLTAGRHVHQLMVRDSMVDVSGDSGLLYGIISKAAVVDLRSVRVSVEGADAYDVIGVGITNTEEAETNPRVEVTSSTITATCSGGWYLVGFKANGFSRIDLADTRIEAQGTQDVKGCYSSNSSLHMTGSIISAQATSENCLAYEGSGGENGKDVIRGSTIESSGTAVGARTGKTVDLGGTLIQGAIPLVAADESVILAANCQILAEDQVFNTSGDPPGKVRCRDCYDDSLLDVTCGE